MQLYPAIDLRGGHVVRLLQGDFDMETRYQNDAVVLAKSYEQEGADWLHVVDLDGAKSDAAGAQQNLAIIERIARETGLKVQTGGGVRSELDVRSRLDAGAARVVVGSVAVRAPELVIAWLAQFGAEQIALALDARADPFGVYRVHAAGWQEAAELELFECVTRFAQAGFRHALVTDIARDGMLSGTNVALYAELKMISGALAVQASGGVANLGDLRALRANQIPGVIIGKALLEGNFSMREALIEAAR
jgi:phosphoribosylformimino-5-aminoimidazole carboxamide ribotide isomerase